jgi:MFS family permease
MLSALAVLAGLPMSLFAGVWTDNFKRRPLMIFADIGRLLILLSVPLAAFSGALSMLQLYVVAFGTAALDVLFRIAYGAYLPSLVGRDAILRANSRLTASSAVAEVGGYAVAGWLVQWLTAPLAVAIDALSFLASALAIWRISEPEAPPRVSRPASVVDEIVAGARFVAGDWRLRVLAASTAIQMFCDGIIGALYLLFVMNTLGFEAGILGLIFAVGGISSLLGAISAETIAAKLGTTRAMVIGVTVAGIGLLFVPMAQGAAAYGLIMLIAHQLVTDGAVKIFSVVSRSFVQTITPNDVIGRVTASLMCVNQLATLIGSITGGVLGAVVGLRAPLIFAAVGIFAAGLLLKAIPSRKKMLDGN